MSDLEAGLAELRSRRDGVPLGSDGVGEEIELELSRSLGELQRLRDGGASAKEMAVPLRYVSMLTLAGQLCGEDRKLAVDAATKLLDRADGRVGSEDVGSKVEVNVVNAVMDDGGRAELARRLSFLGRYAAEKNLVTDVDNVIEVVEE